MRLTLYTDYALRMLIHLGIQRDGRLVTVGEIATAYGISKNHLTKVAHQLGLAGYVETVRGKNGGLRLAKDPTKINLGEIVRTTETELALVPCFDKLDRSCVIAPACGLRGALYQAQKAFLDVLDRYSLADLTKSQKSLRSLLAL